MMDIIEDYCILRNYGYSRLDGSMKVTDRQDEVCTYKTTIIMITQYTPWEQGAKDVTFTACLSVKLKLTFTSPNIISTSSKNVLMGRLISRFFCNFEGKIH